MCAVISVACSVGVAASEKDDDQSPSTSDATPTADLILAIGAPGTDEYDAQFRAWADRWSAAAKEGRVDVHIVSTAADAQDAEPTDDRAALLAAIEAAAVETTRPLWVVLIGHGTFDGRTAKFNLSGPDVSADELAEPLSEMSRPLAVVVCASASGPFVRTLSAEGRVIVTATDGPGEVNFSRFGDYLSRAIGDAAADLDKDEQVSLTEAFRVASSRTDEFYKAEGRIVTEHALLDDNGDGAGTRASDLDDPASTDGRRADQWRLVLSEIELKLTPTARADRDRLELALFDLRDRKSELTEDEYFAQLEALLVQIAEIYEHAGALTTP